MNHAKAKNALIVLMQHLWVLAQVFHKARDNADSGLAG